MRLVLSSMAMLFMAACGSYPVTLNNQAVYTPPPLFSEYTLRDRALKACVQQTILDQKITDPKALKRLNCRHGGIQTLEGLDTFVGLEAVDFANNNLEDVTMLRNFSRLNYVNLDFNPYLKCLSLTMLKQPQLKLIRPQQCL